MRAIKFRGKDLTGQLVYGDLIQTDNAVYIREWTDGTEIEVDSSSVEQFIERDKNGAEVYEGDAVARCYEEKRGGKFITHIYGSHPATMYDYGDLVRGRLTKVEEKNGGIQVQN